MLLLNKLNLEIFSRKINLNIVNFLKLFLLTIM